MISLSSLVDTLIYFYSMLLFVYVLLSWFPAGGFITDVRRVLQTLCEPYLSIFRRVIPPIGMVDISPIVGFIVLGFIRAAIVGLLKSIGM